MFYRVFPLVGTDGVLGIVITGRCVGSMLGACCGRERENGWLWGRCGSCVRCGRGGDGRRVSGIGSVGVWCVGFDDNPLVRGSGTCFVKYNIMRLKELASRTMYQAISLPLSGIALECADE